MCEHFGSLQIFYSLRENLFIKLGRSRFGRTSFSSTTSAVLQLVHVALVVRLFSLRPTTMYGHNKAEPVVPDGFLHDSAENRILF